MARRPLTDPVVQRAMLGRADRKRKRECIAAVQTALASLGAGTLGEIARASDLGLAEAGHALDRLLVEGAIELAGEGVYALAQGEGERESEESGSGEEVPF